MTERAWPAAAPVPGCVHALQRVGSAKHLRGAAAAAEELARIAAVPACWLALRVDRRQRTDLV